jgi:hypothetical protein
MPAQFSLMDFAPLLHTHFRVATLEGYELELTEVTDHSTSQFEQFSLIFTGVPSPWLQQGSYKLAHPQVSECELFLVPLGLNATGMRYQAVFSRFVRKPQDE